MSRRLFQVNLILAALTLTLAVSISAQHQHQESPYVGQEKHEIKALSAEDVNGYVTGQGMGLAKAAELNHYPGPKHVLELSEQLKLTSKQLANTQEIYDRMHRQAVKLGEQIVHKEKTLNQMFASQQISPKELEASVAEIAVLQGKLRAVHLQAHLETKELLTQKQVKQYDQLRGYLSLNR